MVKRIFSVFLENFEEIVTLKTAGKPTVRKFREEKAPPPAPH
jgi:hypothetical protein